MITCSLKCYLKWRVSDEIIFTYSKTAFHLKVPSQPSRFKQKRSNTTLSWAASVCSCKKGDLRVLAGPSTTTTTINHNNQTIIAVSMRVVWLSAESVCHRRVCCEPAESDDPPSAGSPSGSFLNKITQSIGSFTLDCKTLFFRFVAPLNGHKTDPAKQQSCRLFSGCWVSLFGSLGIFSLVWPGWTLLGFVQSDPEG